MMYLICYDIGNPKRLRAMHKLLSEFALRVQYSVFMAQLNTRQRVALEKAIMDTIHPVDDKCLIAPVHSNTFQWLGKPPLADGVILSEPCLHLE